MEKLNILKELYTQTTNFVNSDFPLKEVFINTAIKQKVMGEIRNISTNDFLTVIGIENVKDLDTVVFFDKTYKFYRIGDSSKLFPFDLPSIEYYDDYFDNEEENLDNLSIQKFNEKVSFELNKFYDDAIKDEVESYFDNEVKFFYVNNELWCACVDTNQFRLFIELYESVACEYGELQKTFKYCESHDGFFTFRPKNQKEYDNFFERKYFKNLGFIEKEEKEFYLLISLVFENLINSYEVKSEIKYHGGYEGESFRLSFYDKYDPYDFEA